MEAPPVPRWETTGTTPTPLRASSSWKVTEAIVAKTASVSPSRQPFHNIVVDDFLPADFYRTAEQEYRDVSRNSVCCAHITERFRPEAPAGLNLIVGGNASENAQEQYFNCIGERAALRDLGEALISEVFARKIYGLLFNRSIRNLYGLRTMRIHPPTYRIGLMEKLLHVNCYINLKISLYGPNAGLFQHIDHPSKVISLLFYFGFSDDRVRETCGTQIFAEKRGIQPWARKHRPTLAYFDAEHLELALDVALLPNRMFAFSRSVRSWHAVEPSELPKGVFRESLQMNLMKVTTYRGSLKVLLDAKNALERRLRGLVSKLPTQRAGTGSGA